jgi:hypothetical protein
MIASAPNLNVKKVTTVVSNDCQFLIHERECDEYGNRTCDQIRLGKKKYDLAFHQD